MKNNTLFTAALSLIILMTSASAINAQKYPKGLVDKTVALVGGDMIQLSNIEAEVQMMLVPGITSDKYIRC